jgi:elongation factor Ts
MITSELVKQLRDTTLAPMMECKKALEEAKGDLERAKEILKKQGLIKAEKKIGNQTLSGLIYVILSDEKSSSNRFAFSN